MTTPSKPLDIAHLDPSVAAIFQAATSGDRSARLREWLQTGPSEALLHEVYRELSSKDKGVAKQLKEKIDDLKRSHGQLVLIADEYGTLQGLVTPIDILEAIAGEFPDEDEQPAVVQQGPGLWRIDGAAPVYAGRFVVQDGTVDRVTGTDGLAARGGPVGDAFPEGLVVVQDDINDIGTQNFKYIDWRDIRTALGL